ncbi:MAG: VOC family protein [Gemmatimonadaceae bacterium]|nr:VOC family protein [Gemmatimonadaceae bacterium]
MSPLAMDRDAAPPPPFEASALAASLSCTDLEVSLDWYQRVIGFAIETRHEREGRLSGVSLRAAGVTLLLTQDDFAQGTDRVKGTGFSLQFTTALPVDAIARRIVDDGGVLSTAPTDTPWGARVFRVKDPDGFMLVFSSGA